MTILRYQGISLVLLLFALSFARAEEGGDPIWTTQPTRIDRSKQHFERLPAKVLPRDTRIWIAVPARIKVIDSRSFNAGDVVYEIDHIHPVKNKRLCQAVEGGRWACGRMASIFLGNLVRGKRLLCDAVQSEKKMTLSHCVVGSRDVAAAIVGQGYGLAIGDESLLSVQAAAQKQAAKGLWRNPKCAADFDTC
jgi:endonuclease YncB( thermonuclease family)